MGFSVAELSRVLDDTDVPEGLVAAVISGMCEQQEGGRWRLGIEKCCAFVGKALLEDWVEQIAAKKAKVGSLYPREMSRPILTPRKERSAIYLVHEQMEGRHPGGVYAYMQIGNDQGTPWYLHFTTGKLH